MSKSQTKVVPDGNGGYTQVPAGQLPATASGGGGVGAFFNTAMLGMDADPEAFSDSFKVEGLDFTFRIREVSAKIKANDSAFAERAACELGLFDTARKGLERGGEEVGDEAVQERALQLLAAETFRSSPELSTRFDQLLHERYDAVIIGDPTSADPADWGGLVKWISPALPFSVENARAANIRLKSKIFERVMSLSLYGIDDAQFRRARR